MSDCQILKLLTGKVRMDASAKDTFDFIEFYENSVPYKIYSFAIFGSAVKEYVMNEGRRVICVE